MELYNINKVAERICVNRQILRKWEKEFELKIKRNDTGSRYYTEEEIKLLENIKEWKQKGLSRADINSYINETKAAESECAASIAKLDPITIEDMQETMITKLKSAMSEVIGDIVIDREKELKKEFEDNLDNKLNEMRDNLTEEITHNIKKQVHAENQKLMIYLSSKREDSKKGLLSKIFNKK